MQLILQHKELKPSRLLTPFKDIEWVTLGDSENIKITFDNNEFNFSRVSIRRSTHKNWGSDLAEKSKFARAKSVFYPNK